ncbi:hypothetical protein HDU93_002110, partial [Gonapodya sp. JEL0774]
SLPRWSVEREGGSHGPYPTQIVFTHRTSEKTFGSYIRPASAEYQLGWLLYDPVPNNDGGVTHECIAIVYDSSYTSLHEDKFVVEGRWYPQSDIVHLDLN